MFLEILKRTKVEDLVLYFEQNLGQDNARRILSAYGIERGMDKNLFWARLGTLGGDFAFSRMSQSYRSFSVLYKQTYFTATNTLYLF